MSLCAVSLGLGRKPRVGPLWVENLVICLVGVPLVLPPHLELLPTGSNPSPPLPAKIVTSFFTPLLRWPVMMPGISSTVGLMGFSITFLDIDRRIVIKRQGQF